MICGAFIRRQLLHVCSPDSDLYFPYGRIDFLRSALRWHAEVTKGIRDQRSEISPFTIILQSYRRPWNIEPMVRLFLRFGCVERVIVSNNNPDAILCLAFSDPRLRLVSQPRKYPASKFAMIALEEAEKGARNFLCVDDDLLLFPAQIEVLMRALADDPSVPHGLVGQQVTGDGEWKHHLAGDVPVDILNRVYAFTADHIGRYAELLDALGYRSDEEKATLPFGSDIVLSRSGAGKPRIHDAGRLLSCPTNAKPGIALFKEKNFEKFRQDLWLRL